MASAQATAYRRVVVGYHSTPAGHNALWWAVQQAHHHQAVLFIVRVLPSPRPLPARPLAPPTAQQLEPHTRTEITDALFLAVGDLPAELDVRFAVLYGHRVRTLAHLANQPSDLLILTDPPRPRWRLRNRTRPPRTHSAATTLITTDSTTPPTTL